MDPAINVTASAPLFVPNTRLERGEPAVYWFERLPTFDPERLQQNLLNEYEGVYDNMDRMDSGRSIIVPPTVAFEDKRLNFLHNRIWRSQWRLENEKEPRIFLGLGTPDDVTRDLELGGSQPSAFAHFLLTTGNRFICLFDGCAYSDLRVQRALGHIHHHFEYRPFVCRNDTGCSHGNEW